jgi:hypothetical protein
MATTVGVTAVAIPTMSITAMAVATVGITTMAAATIAMTVSGAGFRRRSGSHGAEGKGNGRDQCELAHGSPQIVVTLK